MEPQEPKVGGADLHRRQADLLGIIRRGRRGGAIAGLVVREAVVAGVSVCVSWDAQTFVTRFCAITLTYFKRGHILHLTTQTSSHSLHSIHSTSTPTTPFISQAARKYDEYGKQIK